MIQEIDYLYDITPTDEQRRMIDRYLKKCQFIYNQYFKDLKAGNSLPVLIKDIVDHYKAKYPSLRENDLLGFYETIILAEKYKNRTDTIRIQSYKVNAKVCSSLQEIKNTNKIVFPILGIIVINDKVLIPDDKKIKTCGISRFADDYYCLKLSIDEAFNDNNFNSKRFVVNDISIKYDCLLTKHNENIDIKTISSLYKTREPYMLNHMLNK